MPDTEQLSSTTPSGGRGATYVLASFFFNDTEYPPPTLFVARQLRIVRFTVASIKPSEEAAPWHGRRSEPQSGSMSTPVATTVSVDS